MLPDIATRKVAIPAALFVALSPGLLLTADGKSVKFTNGKTSQMAVFFHALVFFLMYSMVARVMGLVVTKADLLVTTTLFLALSPGLLLTLPPGSGGVLRSGQTSPESVVVHALVFAIVFASLRRQFPQFY